MEHSKAITLLRGILAEVSLASGAAATEQFGGLREVDAKAPSSLGSFGWPYP